MYLSLLTLQKGAPSVRQCLRNAHDMHRTVMSGFGDVEPSAARSELGVLYRLQEKRSGELYLYVLSSVYPDWSRLQYGFRQAAGSPKNLDALQEALIPGRVLGFDLLCMPAKKVACDRKNSRRRLLVTQEERAQWLSRKAEQNGFLLCWLREEGQSKVYVHKGRPDGKAVYTGVHYRGELRIMDAQKFWRAFASGIGSGKAYGMGMLMLTKTGT